MAADGERASPPAVTAAPPASRGGLRLWCVLGWAALAVWLAFVALVLALRYVVLPRVADFQPQIEAAASQAVGLPVRIGHISARWEGLNPDLVLDDVVLSDRQGRPAFSLRRVESVLSWQSLLRARPILGLLAIEGPVLYVRRAADGRIAVAGLETADDGDPAFARWLLEQQRIRVRDATIVWDDRLRRAPPLVLEDLQFGLDNSGRRHRFGISAAPPAHLAARIDLRGEVHGDVGSLVGGSLGGGNIGEAMAALSGRLFVELDYADLAGWTPWVDYPLPLQQGRGAVRVWGDLEEGAGRLTADLALEEVRIRLGRKVPELDLASMRGRLEGRYRPGEWLLAGHRIELTMQDGMRVVPTDFRFDWRQRPGEDRFSGSAEVGLVDLEILGRLAGYLPLDTRSRELLERHHPQGRIADLKAGWTMEGDTLSRYSLKAAFSDLGLGASGYVPGGAGFSGKVDFNEKGGDVVLDAGRSQLSFPAVFPEPEISLDSLKLHTAWKNSKQGTDVRLERLEFAGPDAAGSARGTYLYTGDGPGQIDLTASVDRADARAVWRYMPHAVGPEVRAWLRRGLTAGQGAQGRLVLKGNLRDFPFRDPSTGRFLVTARASGARVDYVPGWPAIDGIQADMSFGVGMKILASRGAIYGAQLSEVRVEIPDFLASDEVLRVRGVAQGPTGDFLRFIEKSPVAGAIDHFTDGMKAAGNGRLDLELDIPLRHPNDTRVRGDYRFQNNQLQPIAALPEITQVNGRLQLTEKSVTAQDITGRGFGGPVRVQIRSTGDRVEVNAAGEANMAEVNRHFGWPLVSHLVGTTSWRSTATIRQRKVEVAVDSDLVGVTSPLPEPLNKTAATPLPLRIEMSEPDAVRDQYRITLGKVGQGLLIRRGETWERGVLTVGEADLRLPERGLAIRVAAPRIDADLWRDYLPEQAANGKGNDGLALTLVNLRTPQLRLFNRDYSQVDIGLRPREGGWQIALNTREAAGDLFWRNGGEGWLEGNLRRLYVRPGAESGEGGSTLVDSLPGMNLAVEDLRLGDKALGRLELRARNERGTWLLDTLNLQNPDGQLRGRGAWTRGAREQTRLDFELSSPDVGNLLARLGYGEVIKRGAARLTGEVQWSGPLTVIHYPSLGGQLKVEATRGQFARLEPGVGKLLGLISLQSLPRRLTLDFRDIFSDGLAFDRITGELAVRQGIMRTASPLRIKSPAAEIEMEGETDLKNETQDLRVVVRPELSTIAAVGAALINPVAGAATLIASTVVQNPLNRLFSYRYHVTGNWSDPQVGKAGETRPSEMAPPVHPAAEPAPAAAETPKEEHAR